MTDEAQGIMVVAEGWIDADELRWFQQGDFYSANVYGFEPHQTAGEEDPPVPVLIVRDTPEAREALGMDEND